MHGDQGTARGQSQDVEDAAVAGGLLDVPEESHLCEQGLDRVAGHGLLGGEQDVGSYRRGLRDGLAEGERVGRDVAGELVELRDGDPESGHGGLRPRPARCA